MPGISIHVVDVSRGLVAHGMRVSLSLIERNGREVVISTGEIAASGLLEDERLKKVFDVGCYAAHFEIAGYYQRSGVAIPAQPFLDTVSYTFGIDDPCQHYHLPFKCTPWGYSCFRGGA